MTAAVQRLSRQDAGYLRREQPRQPMHFVVLAEVGSAEDGQAVTLQAVRDHVARRLHLVPQMRRRVKVPPLGVGAPVWIDDDHFDVTRHVLAWDADVSTPEAVRLALA